VRYLIILLAIVLLPGCGLLRDVSIKRDTKTQEQRLEDRFRASNWTEDIRIIIPPAYDIPEPGQAIPRPPQRPQLPPGTIIEIRRTASDTTAETISQTAELVEVVDEQKTTEIKSGGTSWILVAFFAGLALALALVVFIILRFR
jgi:hypothetical protein